MSVGKQSVQTWNSVTCPAGVMRPTFFPTAFGLLMKDSVNQKLPSLALVMCSGLLPTVGTLNCFSLSGGAADADVASVAATRVARAADSNMRVRRVMGYSWVESPSTRGIVQIGSPRCCPRVVLNARLWRLAGHRHSALATTDRILRPRREYVPRR